MKDIHFTAISVLCLVLVAGWVDGETTTTTATTTTATEPATEAETAQVTEPTSTPESEPTSTAAEAVSESESESESTSEGTAESSTAAAEGTSSTAAAESGTDGGTGGGVAETTAAPETDTNTTTGSTVTCLECSPCDSTSNNTCISTTGICGSNATITGATVVMSRYCEMNMTSCDTPYPGMMYVNQHCKYCCSADNCNSETVGEVTKEMCEAIIPGGGAGERTPSIFITTLLSSFALILLTIMS